MSVTDAAVILSDLNLDGDGAAGTGLRLDGATTSVRLTEASITDFAIGAHVIAGASLNIERGIISGNGEWGVLSEDSPECQQVTMVYWGAPGGPTDPSDAEDDCMDVAYDGGGDKVSDGVVWWRYAIDEQYTPAAGIGPGAITIYLPSVVSQAGGR